MIDTSTDIAPALRPVAGPPPTAAPRPVAVRAPRGARWLEPVAVAGIVACGLVALWCTTEPNYFFCDDWMNIALARSSRTVTWAELTASYFGHFAPGHRLLDRLVAQRHAVSWPLAVGVMLGAYAACLLAFHWLLRELGIGRGARILATAAYASSVTWVGTTQWWASAAHVEPASLCALVALAAAMRWTRTRSRPMLVLAPLALATGALFFERAQYAVLYFALLRYLVLPPRLAPRVVLARVRHDVPLLAALVAVAAAAVGVVVLGGYMSVGPPATMDLWVPYVASAWLRGTIPLLLGQHGGGASPTVVVLAQVVLVGLVVVSVVRRPAAWRAWAFWMIAWAFGTAALGHARLGAFGLNVAIALRYVPDWGFLLPLTLVLAFRRDPADAAPGRAAVALMRAVAAVPVPVARATAGVVLAALLASCAWSWTQAAPHWAARQGRVWIDTVRREVAAVRATRDAPVVLLDAPAPTSVVAWLPPPEGLLSGVLPFVDDRIRVGGDVPDPFVVLEDGRLRPAVADVVWRGRPSALAGTATGRLRAAGDVVCAKDRGTRVTLETPPASARWQLGVAMVPSARERWLRVDGDGPPVPHARPRAVLRLPRGATRAWAVVGTSGGERVWLTVPRGACLVGVEMIALG